MRSRRAGDQQDGHVDLAKSFPVRWLGALSHAAETVGQANGAIAQPNIALQAQNLVREAALALPDREPLPLVDERLDSGFFDPPRQFLIRLRALVSFVLILNTGGGALQDQRGDPLRVRDAHAKRQSATHRVAKPGGSRDTQLGCHLGEVVQRLFERVARRVLGRRGPSMADDVDGDDPVELGEIAAHR